MKGQIAEVKTAAFVGHQRLITRQEPENGAAGSGEKSTFAGRPLLLTKNFASG